MKYFQKRLLYVILALLVVTSLHSCYDWQNNITSSELIYNKNLELHPGSDFLVGIKFKDKKGKFHSTTGLLKGKIEWDEVDVKVVEGDFFRGTVTPSTDAYRNIKDQLEISYKLKHQKELYKTTLPLSYSGEASLSFNGSSKGSPNDRARRLVPLKILGEGFEGKEGYPGISGTNGRNIRVYVRQTTDTILLKPGSSRLYEIFVNDDDSITKDVLTYAIYPDSHLIINANGGNGGDGGKGGKGVNGRSTKDDKSPGDGSRGGSGGSGGNGGNGGIIKIFFSLMDSSFVSEKMTFNVAAGKGGSGGEGGDGGIGGTSPSGTASNGSKGSTGRNGINGDAGSIEYMKGEFEWPQK